MKKEINFKNWNKLEWNYVTTHKHPNITEFIQNNNCISNTYDKEKNNPQYISMLYNKELKENFTVSTKCSFKSYGAPIIVISDEPSLENNTLKYGVYIEIVLYENGINLWYIDDNKKNITQIIREEFKVDSNKIYNLIVSIDLIKSWIIVSIEGKDNKHIIPFPELKKFKKYYTGITACEGINNFYEFKIIEKKINN